MSIGGWVLCVSKGNRCHRTGYLRRDLGLALLVLDLRYNAQTDNSLPYTDVRQLVPRPVRLQAPNGSCLSSFRSETCLLLDIYYFMFQGSLVLTIIQPPVSSSVIKLLHSGQRLLQLQQHIVITVKMKMLYRGPQQ